MLVEVVGRGHHQRAPAQARRKGQEQGRGIHVARVVGRHDERRLEPMEVLQARDRGVPERPHQGAEDPAHDHRPGGPGREAPGPVSLCSRRQSRHLQTLDPRARKEVSPSLAFAGSGEPDSDPTTTLPDRPWPRRPEGHGGPVERLSTEEDRARQPAAQVSVMRPTSRKSVAAATKKTAAAATKARPSLRPASVNAMTTGTRTIRRYVMGRSRRMGGLLTPGSRVSLSPGRRYAVKCEVCKPSYQWDRG